MGHFFGMGLGAGAAGLAVSLTKNTVKTRPGGAPPGSDGPPPSGGGGAAGTKKLGTQKNMSVSSTQTQKSIAFQSFKDSHMKEGSSKQQKLAKLKEMWKKASQNSAK